VSISAFDGVFQKSGIWWCFVVWWHFKIIISRATSARLAPRRAVRTRTSMLYRFRVSGPKAGFLLMELKSHYTTKFHFLVRHPQIPKSTPPNTTIPLKWLSIVNQLTVESRFPSKIVVYRYTDWFVAGKDNLLSIARSQLWIGLLACSWKTLSLVLAVIRMWSGWFICGWVNPSGRMITIFYGLSKWFWLWNKSKESRFEVVRCVRGTL
jgi:hypothetical protein